MSEFQWVEVRLRAIELFLDAPAAAQEQRVLDVFREHPNLVIEAIEHVGRRLAQGQIRNPWAILAKHVEEAVRPLEDVTATDERDREKAVRRGEQWMRAVGKQYDSEVEILDELFGQGGALRMFDTPELRERLVRLWREVRPEGELIQAQAEERANAYVEAWGQTQGSEGRLVTIPPWRSPKMRQGAAAVDDPEPVARARATQPESDAEPVDDDPEPVPA